jgi:hypothetical protein
MLQVLQAQAAKLGDVKTLIADVGYCSENNVKACEHAGLEPLLSVARQDHHPHWRSRFTQAGRAGRRCDTDASHDTSFERARRQSRVRPAQADGGAGLWHHQIGDGGSGSFLYAVCAKSQANGIWFVWPGMSSAWRYCVQKRGEAGEYRGKSKKTRKKDSKCLFF